jgi:hypothetical protein
MLAQFEYLPPEIPADIKKYILIILAAITGIGAAA